MPRRLARWGFALAWLAWGAAAPADDANGSYAGTVLVVDAEGRPVPDATVVVALLGSNRNRFDGERVWHATSTTGPDGRSRFDIPAQPARHPIRYIQVVAHREGFTLAASLDDAGSFPSRSVLDRRRRDAGIRLVLAAPRPYSGLVIDPLDEQVEGARVALLAFVSPAPRILGSWNAIIPDAVAGTPLAQLVEATTDAAGRFAFPSLPDPGLAQLRVTARGMATVRVEQVSDEQRLDEALGVRARLVDIPRLDGRPVAVPPEEGPTPIVLRPEARLAGRVTTALPGVAVGGLKVWVIQAEGDDASRIDLILVFRHT